MGCDIHEYYEIRRGGTWVEADLNPLPDTSMLSNEEEDRVFEASWAHPLHIVRDYDLYAFLANVRNHIGIKPISPPRGLPADLSEGVRAKWDDSGYYHHESWLSLDELLRFDWDQPLRDLDLTEDGVRRRLERGLQTYRDVAANTGFVNRVLPYLQLQVPDPRDLRIVFWFDN